MPNTTVPAAATGLPTDTTYRPDVLLRRTPSVSAIPSKPPVERAGNSRARRAVRDETKFRARLSGDTKAPNLADLIAREQLRARIEAAVARLIDALDAIDAPVADREPEIDHDPLDAGEAVDEDGDPLDVGEHDDAEAAHA